jgi:hypothetical protein
MALPADGGVGESALARAVVLARQGDTVQLGNLLAPYSVRYVVVPSRTGSIHTSGLFIPPPADVLPALGSQIDLRRIQSDQSLDVYENTSWAPIRSMLTPEGVLGAHSGSSDTLPSADLSKSAPVLGQVHGQRQWAGPLPVGELFVGEAHSDAWRLWVNGHRMTHQPAFRWANTYTVNQPGHGVLRYEPQTGVVVAQLVDAGALLLLVLFALRYRSRRGRYA